MSLAGKHIFIVEDNTLNRVIYQMILTRCGAWIEFDRWGRNTLVEMEKCTPIDLIILDLMLPSGESGYDIYTKIRRIGKFASVPIVAVSAADPSFAIPRTREMGFSGFISKPINDELLPGQLDQILGGTTVWYTGTPYQSTG